MCKTKLMEEPDPKAVSLQDVREAVQKELLKGEEPKNVAMFTAIVDPPLHIFTARIERRPVLRNRKEF